MPYSWYEVTISLITKPDKDTIQKNKSNEYRHKVLIKYYQTEFNNTSKGSDTMIKWDLFQGAKMVQYMQINQCDIPY